MDLRDLKLFLHLAESCHFGRTARAMHVSPSTLSRQIQRLEEDVGHALFLRDNRTVALTEAGERLKLLAATNLTAVSTNCAMLWIQWSLHFSGELRLFCSGDRRVQPSAPYSGSLSRRASSGRNQTHHRRCGGYD
ncbi:LysR family transcriptional regulator [Pantoea ananatis]